MTRAISSALATVLAGCGTLNLYTVDVALDLTDELDVPVREQPFDLCAEAVFDDGEVVSLGCDREVTSFEGRAEGRFSITDGRGLDDVLVTASIEGTSLEGGASEVRQGPVQLPEGFVDVDVDAAFVAPRAVLPEQVTRFRLSGSVFGEREGGIPSESGTVFVDISLDGGDTVRFAGSAPATTDASGVYSADIDVVSNFFFAISKETVTTRIDIDGYQGDGVDLVVLEIDGRDPRVVNAFSSF